MRSEGYLQNLELVAKRARFLAAEAQRAAPTDEDVEQALAYMLPGSSEPVAAPPPKPRSPTAGRLQAPEPGKRISSRGITPAQETADLPRLRGALVTA
jgi:hypothetical protein